MKLSQLFGKPVLSTAGKKGYIISVNGNAGKVQCLVCADENENEFSVDIKNVISVKNTVLYEDRESVLKQSVPIRLGKPVFDSEGKFLGHLADFTVENGSIDFAHVGKKKFSANDFVCGDAVILRKQVRVLKSDVEKDGKVIIKRGTPLTPEVLEKACEHGEYVQANLKSI
ncbi:MAG: hypothetical protein K2I30_06025 [Clostridia bacterium]|nr:hypothetical protein [Clostridia bacterium]